MFPYHYYSLKGWCESQIGGRPLVSHKIIFLKKDKDSPL